MSAILIYVPCILYSSLHRPTKQTSSKYYNYSYYTWQLTTFFFRVYFLSSTVNISIYWFYLIL